MNLYVWEGSGVLSDYTNGMIVAIGNDLQEAVAAVKSVCSYGAFPEGSPTSVVKIGRPKGLRPMAWYVHGGG